MAGHEDWISGSYAGGKFGDLIRPNRFKVKISNLPSGVPGDTQQLSLNAMGAQVSPISVDIGVVNLNSWILNYYKERTDADLSITFLDTVNLDVRSTFNEWMRLGFDFQSKRRGFFDDIKAGFIEVIPLDNKGKDGRRKDVYTEVFPFEINDLNYDMAQENQILRTEVKFKFIVHDVIGIGETINVK